MKQIALMVLAVSLGASAGGLATQKSRCKSGHVASCMDVGAYYASRDKGAQAAPYLSRACDRGMADACDDLAYIYANAKGVRQSYTKAMRYWSRGCRLGSGSACANYDLAKARVRKLRKR
jgi:TPR repeat protein